jgi:hypothetical protein
MTRVSDLSQFLTHAGVGLALLIGGRERIGERIRVYDPLRNGDLQADIVDPVFF